MHQNWEQIPRNSLRQSVYDRLQSAFMMGAFSPGDSVNLRDLAKQFGTSMTPIREAIRRLVGEGALIDTPSRTLQVPPFDVARLTDLKRARLALESLVTGIAIEIITDEEIKELEKILSADDHSSASLSETNLNTNHQFHFTLYRASKSSILLTFIESLWIQYGPYLNLIIHSEQKKIDVDKFHRDIIKALQARNVAKAQKAIVKDISRSFDALLKMDITHTG